jgi:ribonuclease P protein component
MNNTFKKKEHLTNKKDFNNVFQNGNKIVNDYFVIYFANNDIGNSRIGLAVKKRIGKANVRNRIIRLVKEYFRLNKSRLKNNYDFLFVIRVGFNLFNYKSLAENLDDLLQNLF